MKIIQFIKLTQQKNQGKDGYLFHIHCINY